MPQVMRHMAEGLVAFLLKRHDHAKPILRAASRELLSSCVLRSLMTFFTPYTANKVPPPGQPTCRPGALYLKEQRAVCIAPGALCCKE